MNLSTFLPAVGLALWIMPAGAAPDWIWSSTADERVDFRKIFEAPAELQSATLTVACDNYAMASIERDAVLENGAWAEPTRMNVKRFIKPGRNEIRISARNEGGPAGLLVRLEFTERNGARKIVESGGDWEASAPGQEKWGPVMVLGKLGVAPWGDVFAGLAGAATQPTVATKADDIKTLPGFRVEHLYTVPKLTQGSWVSLTVDPKGRLICGDQNGGLYRLTPPPTGASPPVEPQTKVEKLATKVGGAHGLLFAFDSLYLVCNERATPDCQPGLWRLRDTDGDDQFDEEKFLRRMEGGGEHGPHGIALSPDGKSLYICGGNHTKLPEKLEASRAARAWSEDHLLPRMWDAGGHAVDVLAPGGYICKTDPEGKRFELFCYGFRNHYDLDFNADGELFTYDSDMEWDMGVPWYRPTRVVHCVSGADYGWRSGSGVWPDYWPDNLPPTVDMGPGSPTGATFGKGAKFPAKYQSAFYANDWTFGTMYAVHLIPNGASYRAEVEEFLSAKPLPLTDVVISPKDGAMYFAIGGRKTQSAVYRVTHRDQAFTSPESRALTSEQRTRREIEAMHEAKPDSSQVAKVWSHLASADRFIRYAARVVLEKLPAADWVERVWIEPNSSTVIEGAVALARSTGAEPFREKLIDKLRAQDFGALALDQRLALLRAYQLVFTRLGRPSPEVCAQLAAALDSLYPAKDDFLDRELCQLLVYLESPAVVAKTLQLIATARELEGGEKASSELLARNDGYARSVANTQQSRPNRQQIALAWSLRCARTGWTPELRRQYFTWFSNTRKWRGGNSFAGFLNTARREALANVTDANERGELDALSTKERDLVVASFNPPKGPGRPYTVDEALKLCEGRMSGRDFARGKNLFVATACLTCHRFAGEGGGLGPDLTGSANRYSLRDLLENIIDPSKAISDQYESTMIEKTDGSVLVGRILQQDGGKISVAMNPLVPGESVEVRATDVKERKPYPISMMPPALLNQLNEDEVLDLVAYIQSGGNPGDKAFQK
ncbi:MAG: c-type cytochrome [Verrucomicrobiales bacterium]